MDSVMATLYAAKKYIVPHLVCECVRLLETRLSAANACQLLSQCRLFDEAGLTRRCWQVARFDDRLVDTSFDQALDCALLTIHHRKKKKKNSLVIN